ncbi:MAG: molybdate ABC transporter substrate-binding protein [Gammaproteobacteria bacterium]|jgi:molybdate transport system substrate-binding protein|nr:molybdate ABC transporter substrate-binding protein [Gammaproteobacteria bacterium]MBT3723453.1 molybdate ABC transporter substrate-binding protein [Gammaproteobacteria bacterium]MBT4075903.1 molybdate ABC transporter substrate-binding protein [Gammaproteobacteria bacterium]MBT4196236.1 molybdate ABC transporter substrate-binding protein [Gammaproteobacteria bacterium]MBT4451957.1 molybdate ABC transporter substrate-binding protein [Gammaproteobacteria bacterium]
MKNLFIFVLLFTVLSPVYAGEIRVAVASNFANALKDITKQFEKSTGHKVKISVGSTGKHYAQIKNGAPFDVFLAADTRRPELLDNEGIAIAGSRFTYARGKLVLWSPQKNLIDENGLILATNAYDYLAIANPKLAPYGKAAQQVLQAKSLWNSLRSRMVRGENIGQTFQFVKSGNAQLGFVAASQVKKAGVISKGSFWEVPQQDYTAINQQAVLLSNNEVSSAFVSFLRSEKALSIIRDFGYETL